jgi:hypothetical protein
MRSTWSSWASSLSSGSNLGSHVDGNALADLQRALATGSALERKATALALAACADPKARELVVSAPDLTAALEQPELSWEHLVSPP